MKRKIVQIDESKCNGCGLCIPNCHEGAIQLIAGKARIISDLFCDGLGACVGECPQGAISIIEREAEPYRETIVLANIIKQGPDVLCAHLKHLYDHKEHGYLQEAFQYLREQKIDIPQGPWSLEKNPTSPCTCHTKQEQQNAGHGMGHEHGHAHAHGMGHACPGAKAMDFRNKNEAAPTSEIPSQLRHWPIQLHLVSPHAGYFRGQHLLVAADCTAYALGCFHQQLQGKSLVIACPKLDENLDVYVEKIKILIDEAEVASITVMIMEVPCCRGLLSLVTEAASQAKRKIPISYMVVGIQGNLYPLQTL